MAADGLTLVQIIRVPTAGVDALERFEAAVLPLLGEHGGAVEERFRTVTDGPDGAVEVHVLRFRDRAAIDAYRVDPRRAEQLPLWEASGAEAELLEVLRLD